MRGYSVDYWTAPRFGFANETSVLHVPRGGHKTDRCGVLYAHGAGGNALQSNQGVGQLGLTKICAMLAHAGYSILSADWGGPQTYGNDAEMNAMYAGAEWLQTQGVRTDKVIVLGGSMGNMSIHRYAADHPAEVAGIGGFIPAIDIEALRITNALGLRDHINAAWGLPAGSTGATNPVPIRGRMLDRIADFDHIPTMLWHTEGDTATLSEDVYQYVSLRTPGTATEVRVSTTLDHSDAAILAVNIDQVIDFVDSCNNA